MKRRSRLLSLVALSSLCACFEAPQPPSDPPNIVIFLADDLGWGDVGYLGSEIQTPAIDRLAREGVVLSSFYVQPVCSPSRAALLTGRYPIRYGFQLGVIRPWSTSGLSLDEALLPQLLQIAGYATHIVGKWHLGAAQAGELPTQRGFDHHYGQYTGLVDYWTHEREGGLDWHRDGRPVREEGYATHLLRDEAVRVVRAHNYTRPLFLYLPFSAPHFPLQAPEEDVARYEGVIEDEARRVYAAMVSCMDEAMGAVLKELDSVGQRENTLVLFLSDNGAYLDKGGSNGALRGEKSGLEEGAVRSPAVLSWPQGVEGGTELSTPMHLVDLSPTLLSLARMFRTGGVAFDGVDLGPHLISGEPVTERAILLNTQAKHGALREGRWKLMVNHAAREKEPGSTDPTLGLELYDLEVDPGEAKNLAAENPDICARLLKSLMRFHSQRQPVPQDRGPRPADFKAPAVFGPRE